ncbi:MAG: lipopolysaccharide heptosyltransferase [Pseudomonadota bacterium]|jgi:heptosyltransferase-2
MPDQQPGRILVVGPSWIGDMVMCQALFMALKQRLPGSELTVLAPDWSLPLLSRMPEVDHALVLPFRHGELNLSGRWRVARSLHGFDQAIVIPNSFKSALIPWFARIPRRTGWVGECRHGVLNDCRRLQRDRFPLMVQRLVALGLPAAEYPPDHVPSPRLGSDSTSSGQTLSELGLTRAEKTLVLCPGAEFGAAKQWPARHFAALAEVAMADGWQIWLLGSAGDRAVAAAITDHLAPSRATACRDLTGRTSLIQAIDLLSVATAVVSNDSGLMHVAAALEKPVVAIYGSTSPDFTPPLADRVKLLHTDIACRPCFQRQCPLGHLRCLTEIGPDRVYQQLNDLLAQ